jgi:hypothetical protein
MRAAAQWLTKPINMAVVAFTFAPFLLLLIFLDTYQANLPRGDDFARGMPVAIATIEGDLTLDKLLGANIGQVAVFNKMITAVLTVLTDWNLVVEMYVTVAIAIVGFLLLVWLIARYHPQVAPVVIILASILYFSVHQNTNWYISHNSWFLPQLFFLLTTITLYLMPRKPSTFALAILLAIAATYSHGNGIVVWPAMIVALWVRGYRHWAYFAVWVVIAGVSAYGYTQLAGVAVTTEPGHTYTQEVNVVSPVESLRFALGVLGSMFISNASNPAIRVGALALVMLTINLLYLWRVRRLLEVASLWFTLSLYSIGTALLIGITRFNTYPTGLDEALGSRYLTSTVYLWLAIFVSGAVVIWDASTRPNSWKRGIAAVNIGVGALLAALFGPSVYVTLQRPYYDEQKNITEDCYMRALYIQDSVPLFAEGCPLLMGVHIVNELSVYELAMFAQDEKVNMLGDTYQPGTPVLVEGDHGWVNYHVQKWLLEGVQPEDVVHITPEQPVSDFDYRDVTLTNALIDADSDRLTDTLNGHDAFWVVQRADMASSVADFWDQIEREGFLPTSFTFSTDEAVDFTVTRYQRIDLTEAAVISFGDTLELVVAGDRVDTLAACEPLTVRSFWQTPTGDLLDGYSATVTLDHSHG